MDAIGIENLRCLSNTGLIKLKPLTVLVGQNNSGKSTFLRALPLLRQSVESRTMGPILWDDIVDFGSFHEAVNHDSEKPEIIFHFQFILDNSQMASFHGSVLPYNISLLEDLNLLLTLNVSDIQKQGMTRAKECLLSFADHKIRIVFDNDGKVTTFLVNSLNVLELTNHDYYLDKRGKFIPYFDEIDQRIEPHLLSEITKQVHTQTRHNTKTIVDVPQELFVLGSSKAMLANLRENGFSDDYDDFQTLKNRVIAFATNQLLRVADNYIATYASDVNYLAPVRATAERYYRIQELAVDEVDSNGRNLAMFLRNLTEDEREEFAQWTEKYFAVVPQFQSLGGHFSLKLKERGGKTAFNIADMGFGFSQVLPIVTELWRLISPQYKRSKMLRLGKKLITFAIEQPELHLHPSLQAQLVDAFLAAIKAAREVNIDLRLIIETHSETLINRLGHRIANGDVQRQDINIVVFEKEHANAPAQVSVAEYDEEGFLTNWPFGFFEHISRSTRRTLYEKANLSFVSGEPCTKKLCSD
jgi:predicted ATPase